MKKIFKNKNNKGVEYEKKYFNIICDLDVNIIKISIKRKTHSLYKMGKMFKEGQHEYFDMYKTNFIFHF